VFHYNDNMNALHVCSALLLVGCGVGVWAAQAKGKAHAKPGDKVVGHLKWEITDTKTGKVIGKGDRKVKRADITIAEVGGAGERLDKEQIQLGNHFSMTLANGASNGDGFGLTADRDDVPTFAWEWFEVQLPATGTKLQEDGKIQLKWKGKPGGRIAGTLFLTDVSLRVIRTSDSPDADPVWRVKIFKGSTIDWP
jgi:hypothetical protein